MAQTKKKRRRKHKGTQAGTVERRAATAGKPKSRQEAKDVARQRRAERLDRPPTWKASIQRAAVAAVLFGVLLLALFSRPPDQVVIATVLVFLFYVPMGYALDTGLYRFRQRRRK